MKLTQHAQIAVDTAIVHGGRPLIVGGAVRDHLLGRPCKDIDIEIHGMSAEVFSGPFMSELKMYSRVDEVGASFGVLMFGRDVDISMPRSESKTGSKHTDFHVTVDPSLTVEQALARRDFTIGSMAYDPRTGELIDPFGGQRDLDARIIRHTSAAFSEDPLRVVRAIRFAAQLGFLVDVETADLCRELIPEQEHLAQERVWAEWEKALAGTHQDHLIMALRATGYDRLLPMLPLDGFQQERVALVAPDLPTRRLYVLASWMDGMTTEDRSAFLSAIGAPRDIRRLARRLRGAIDSALSFGTPSRYRAHKIARAIVPLTCEDVVRVIPTIHLAARFHRVARDAGCLTGPVPALITGHDLIALGMEPGPAFGVLLRALIEAQDYGQLTTKEMALMMIKEGEFG